MLSFQYFFSTFQNIGRRKDFVVSSGGCGRLWNGISAAVVTAVLWMLWSLSSLHQIWTQSLTQITQPSSTIMVNLQSLFL